MYATSSPEAPPTFNTREVAKRCGVSLRKLQYWDEMSIVVPENRKGNRRCYTRKELFEIALIAEMGRKGIPVTRAQRYVVTLRRGEHPDPLVECAGASVFFVIGEDMAIVTVGADETLRVVTRSKVRVYVIDSSKVLAACTY